MVAVEFEIHHMGCCWELGKEEEEGGQERESQKGLRGKERVRQKLGRHSVRQSVCCSLPDRKFSLLRPP